MKNYIWTIPTRLFHWLLAISFAAAYILGESDELKNLHFAFGVFVGVLIFFRLLYGLFGPKYSHFRDFPIGLKKQTEFIKTFFSNTKHYAGHNPLASLVMLGIFIVGFACSISGFLIYATENNTLNINLGDDFLEGAHEITANLFLALVFIHLIGIIADVIFHGKNGTMRSIFSGYKNIESENVKLNISQKFFSILWFIIPFIFFYWAYGLQIANEKSENERQKTEKSGNNESEEDAD
jgi:cytochrome b